MATPAEIKEQVLWELGVVNPGQTASSTITGVMTTRYTQLHALYSERNIFQWALADDIPDEAAKSVVDILADDCIHVLRHETDISAQRRLEIAARRERAEKDLRLVTSTDYQPYETHFEDF